MNDTNTLTVVPTELEKAVEETHLSPEGANSLKAAFAPHFIRFHELAIAAKAIPESSPKAARAMRLEIRAVRLAAETTRKELGEDALRRKRAIDGVNNLLLYTLTPIEKHLEAIERAEEIREEQRLAELKEGREKALTALGVDVSHFRLEAMPDEMFEKVLSDAKAAHEAKLEEARKAEEARLAKEAAERAERERLRIENERLKREAAERDKVIAAERERLAKEQRAAAETLRLERDKLAKERAEIEAREAAEQEAREQELNRKIAEELAAIISPVKEGTPSASSVEYREAITGFGAAMLEKLEEKAHKGTRESWQNLPPRMLVGRISEEAMELLEAVDAGDAAAAMREAADVANFAMMVWDFYACRQLPTAEKSSEEARTTP